MLQYNHRPILLDVLQHPIAITSASQTDGCDAIQTYTQTDDKILHEMATQTEDEEVPDSPKRVVEEPQQVPTFERVEPVQQSSKGVAQDEQPSKIPTPEDNWDDLRNFGEPRIVVSVIGAYNECTQTYEWADHLLLKNAIAHVARYSGRCGFVFNEKNTDFVNSVVSRSCVIKGLPQKYGYTSMHFSDRPQKHKAITIFDIKFEEHDRLWERITDGIIRAWSFEEKHDKEPNDAEVLKTDNDSLNGGEYISKYVANIDGLTRRELFAIYGLTKPNEKKDTIEINRQDVFATSFHGGKIDMMEDILNSDEKFSMSKSTFQGLWKQSVCPSDIEDPNAPLYIADELLKGLCCSKIGMITCCKRCRNKEKGENSDNIPDTVPTNETLLVAVLLNKTEKAAALWHQFDNPMMTALISSMFLTSLANIAEEKFEENRQNQYQSHAKLFLSRAVLLLEKMFTDDEQMAIEALDHVCDVWGNIESPLHFGHQFNIEEFISHSSNQKDASKRLFAYNVVSVEDINLDITDEPETENAPPREQKVTPTTSIYSITISGWFSFIKNHWRKNSKLSIMTAPVTMIVIHLLFFITALMMFSYFLTRDLQPGSINLLEGLIFIYMLGDLLEEIWSMIRPQKDCHWSPQRIFLHIFNIWNILDFLCFILYILGFCMHILDSDLIAHTRRIYSIALFIMFLRLLNFLLLSKRFGIIIIMVKEMVSIIYNIYTN
ncbi:Hypothetical predicted protein [Mytilus galloprovincialis]|uniref:TRPM-like domain-containing protein n=1 Tax=Mytilus galloprovincialis TaxID=29158 RepID=A0A8B6F4H8_MYTGA|nr:Hypothetical predicted protein [Mytilus galloprovincialis]